MSNVADSVQAQAASGPAVPTEGSPESGVLSIFGVDLSRAEYWAEAGEHVIRSTEFDVIAAGPTFEDALAKLADEIVAFAVYLAELGDRGENEDEMLRVLAPRMIEAVRRAPRGTVRPRRRRLLGVTVTLTRRRSDDASRWHRSRPHDSSLPSLA